MARNVCTECDKYFTGNLNICGDCVVLLHGVQRDTETKEIEFPEHLSNLHGKKE